MLSFVLLSLAAVGGAAASEATELAAGGVARMPVVTAEGADERTRTAAGELASMLERISGAPFTVATGDGTHGIAVGTLEDFAGLDLHDPWDARGLGRREQYWLQSHEQGIYVLGAEQLGVQHAVWDLLYHLGYRQFFPGRAWEVVPEIDKLDVKVDVTLRPDYYNRRIWYGYGLWNHNAQAYRHWQKANRAPGGFSLETGHSYDGIYSRNRELFDANPQFFAQLDGRREHRRNIKFCLSNRDARAAIVADRVRAMSERPRDSVSIDPSDGGGWCQCDGCAAIGSVSDQAVLLANEVAEAVVAEHGQDVYVGMYAYSQHAPPPTTDVHPNVIISTATSFIRGGYSVDQLIEGWQQRGATLGIREYYSVHTWDRDLPGRARGSNLDYLARTIPHFHRHGARYMSAESSDNWGPNGLGYYLAQRMLWDTGEAERIDELAEDFLDRAFGQAKEPMRQFYALIDGARQPLMSDDLLGRMYRHLAEARQATDDPAAGRRIDELTLWTHYVERFRLYSEAQGPQRQQNFERLIRHGYRMRDTMLIHAKALYRDLANRDRNVTIPEGAGWNVPEQDNPWKDSTPFSPAEIDRIRARGIGQHELIGFQPVAFSSELVPAAGMLGLSGTPPAGSFRGRGRQVFHVWMPQSPATISIDVTGGLIAHYRDRGDVVVHLYPADEVEGLAVASGSTPPDGQTRTIALKTEHAGHHRIEYNDGSDMTQIQWPEGLAVTWELGAEHTARFSGRQNVYFYVPKQTPVVGGYISGGRGTLQDAEGETALDLDGRTGFFEVPVPQGHDGRLWKLQAVAGQLKLMTVPPQVSPSPAGLLLPREVVEQDRQPGPAKK